MSDSKEKRIAVRIPNWCKDYSISSNGIAVKSEVIKGYAYFSADSALLNLSMTPQFVHKDIKLIPYFSFANRGESEMLVYLLHS